MNLAAQPSGRDPIRVTFDPGNREVGHPSGQSLLATAQHHGITIASACGGRGICKTCAVRFIEGPVPEASAADRHFFTAARLEKGWRRACQIEPEADCRVHIPARARASSARMQVDGSDFWIPPEPLVRAYQLSLVAPSLGDSLADADRLIRAVSQTSADACTKIDAQVLRSLPESLRQHGWKVQAVVRRDEIIAVQAQGTKLVGLAVDLGTTNIGIFLVNLRSGTTIASVGIENPQVKFGSDIIARVGAAATSQGSADQMHGLVIDAINQAVGDLCKNHHLKVEQIIDVVVAGNTVMHHLFARLPVKNLGLAPFAPVIAAGMDLKAGELGLHGARGAWVHMLPNIAGFIGGDHTAMLLGIRADTEQRTVIALDIGTNSEISLIHQGKVSSLSCPSGPALEGGHISCGMRAAAGAIEGVAIEDDRIGLKIIGEAEPLGICGSAVLDIVAAFYCAGGINPRGHIRQDYVHATQRDGGGAFLLHEGEPEVVFTQQDIRAVQLAKGAIRAGIDLLLETAGLDCGQLDKIVVAGAFGLYIRIESAIAIGLFPDLPADRFEQVGNAAGIGAKLSLVSFSYREKARLLAAASQHVGQAGNARFNELFMRSINFPEWISGQAAQ